jgi:uridine kinase
VAHNHEVAGSSPAPATISTTTSVIKTEVFYYLKFLKKLIGSSPGRWFAIIMNMSISQEAAGTAVNEREDLVEATLRENFKLQKSGLTSEQVSRLLTQTIQDLPLEGVRVISIVGGPASGKGTLVGALTSGLNQAGLRADSIGTDDYNLGTRAWRWEREREDPISLKDFALLNRHIAAIMRLNEGETVAVPVYDQPTGLAIEVGEENFPHKVGKVDVLFVEGDFDAVDNPDLLVFLDVPMETRMQARIDRDLKERGEVNPKKVASSFKSRHEKQYVPHTAPAIKRANLVLRVHPTPEAWNYDVYQPKTSGSTIAR